MCKQLSRSILFTFRCASSCLGRFCLCLAEALLAEAETEKYHLRAMQRCPPPPDPLMNINSCMTSKLPIVKKNYLVIMELVADNFLLAIVNKYQCNCLLCVVSLTNLFTVTGNNSQMYSKIRIGDRNALSKLPIIVFQMNSISLIESEEFRETPITLLTNLWHKGGNSLMITSKCPATRKIIEWNIVQSVCNHLHWPDGPSLRLKRIPHGAL